MAFRSSRASVFHASTAQGQPQKLVPYAARAGVFRLVRTVPGAGSVDLGSAQSPHPGARSPSVTAARCKGSQFTINTKKLNYTQDVVVQNLNPSICENLYRFALDRRTTFRRLSLRFLALVVYSIVTCFAGFGLSMNISGT
jgi:hypothetical protein